MKTVKSSILLGAILAMSQNVMALPTDRTDITVYDGDSTGTGWRSAREDQEVEPGMQTGQVWDNESFFIDHAEGDLGLITGFDLKNGYGTYKAGDIFIDIDGDHISGDATENDGNGQEPEPASNFGYDYVMEVNWATGTYNLLGLPGDAQVRTAYYDQNYGSSPFEYISGGTDMGSDLTFSGVESGLDNATTGFLGGTHFAAFGFDLGFLGDQDAFFHFTMGCGNDNLAGFRSVPEPSTLVLLMAAGLAGLFGRKKLAA